MPCHVNKENTGCVQVRKLGTDKCQLNCETVHVVWVLKLESTLTLPEEASWMISKLESGTEEEANLKRGRMY